MAGLRPGGQHRRVHALRPAPAVHRAGLLRLLEQPAKPATEVYPADDSCKAGEQWCSDAIIHRALGGITHPAISRQNRPTYQQVVEFPFHR
ncbi:hypothetical protein [Streptomyces sp. NPDC005407]|uniref:hypothetical protein n=1 Tax=Streptomyces sp. NPDC005407 TaxID=3155340 RepID=UPI0033AF7631